MPPRGGQGQGKGRGTPPTTAPSTASSSTSVARQIFPEDKERKLRKHGSGGGGEKKGGESQPVVPSHDPIALEKVKAAKAKREATTGDAMDDILRAYQDKPKADRPPPPPPRTKKFPCYKLRKCFGCAHVDIEVAIIEGHASVVRRTVRRLSKIRPGEVNQYFKDGCTPLILSMKEKREDVIAALLQSPAINVDLKDQKTGLYPLHLAMIYGLSHTVKLFMDRPYLDVEVKDKRGMTPIMVAAMVGNMDYFMPLVERGADLKVVDKEGWNLLVCAAYGGSKDICQWLLEAGFDKDHEDKRKHTAYDWAMFNEMGDAAATIAEFKDALDDYDPVRARELAAKRRV